MNASWKLGQLSSPPGECAGNCSIELSLPNSKGLLLIYNLWGACESSCMFQWLPESFEFSSSIQEAMLQFRQKSEMTLWEGFWGVIPDITDFYSSVKKSHRKSLNIAFTAHKLCLAHHTQVLYTAQNLLFVHLSTYTWHTVEKTAWRKWRIQGGNVSFIKGKLKDLVLCLTEAIVLHPCQK